MGERDLSLREVYPQNSDNLETSPKAMILHVDHEVPWEKSQVFLLSLGFVW